MTQISTDGRDADEAATPGEDDHDGTGIATGTSTVQADVEPEPARGGRPPLTDQQKKVLAVVAVVHLIVAAFTLRDLKRRPAEAVRGPKLVWRLWATLNTTGSVAYWLFGRRARN